MIFTDRRFSLRCCGSIYRRSSLLTIYSTRCDFLFSIDLCIYRRRGIDLTELDAEARIIQRRFQRRVLRGLHIASGRSLRLFHRRGEIGNGLVVLSGQKYLRLINGDLVCDPQPVQQHFSIGAGQSEPERGSSSIPPLAFLFRKRSGSKPCTLRSCCTAGIAWVSMILSLDMV